MIPVLVLTFLISVAGVSFLLPNITRIADKNNLYDVPDDRHIHVGKIPRLGGVAFLPVMIIALIVAVTMDTSIADNFQDDVFFLHVRQIMVAGIGTVILYLVGMADDLSGVPYRNKFIAQIAAAAMMCASGVWINNLHGFLGIWQLPVWVGVPLTVLLVLLVVNSINLIDGIDGLASGLCIIGMSSFAVIFTLQGFYRFAVVAVAAIGCLVPFYCYNVFGKVEKKNKIFMGDTGSLFMGYLLAFFAVKISMLQPAAPADNQSFYLVYAYSTLLLPAFDVMRVFMKRVRRTRNPFLPDKTHIHHKFLALGLNMRQARMLIFIIAIFFFGMNISLSGFGVNINVIVLLDLVLWCGYHMLLTGTIIRRYRKPGVATVNSDLTTW